MTRLRRASRATRRDLRGNAHRIGYSVAVAGSQTSQMILLPRGSLRGNDVPPQLTARMRGNVPARLLELRAGTFLSIKSLAVKDLISGVCRKCMGPGLRPGAGCRGCGTPCQGYGDRVPVLHKIMQIRPLQPSLMMRSMVSRTLPRASVGIRYSLLCSPSLTSSCSDLPKIFDSQISDGL